MRAGIVLLLLAGCTADLTPAWTPTSAMEVDPLFREFYNRLGGQTRLGEALLPLEQKDGLYLQYTTAAVMEYDPTKASSMPYSLAPLGEKLFHSDIQGALANQTDATVVDGFVVYPKFLSLYQAFNTTQFAGTPLSYPLADEKRGIILQYFQNIGMYTSLTDATDSVHLLAYGGYDCRATCAYAAGGVDSPQEEDLIEQPFLDSVLGWGTDFTGSPLSEPYVAANGSLEQVYAHVVVYTAIDQATSVHFQPLPQRVGIDPTLPVAKQAAQGLTFVPVANGLGHNVATVFVQYRDDHGGAALSGAPTTEIFTAGNRYRQCFTHYCLDFDPQATGSSAVQPASLGVDYLQKYPVPAQADALTLQVTVKQATLSSKKKQEFDLQVSGNPGLPSLEGVEAKVTVTLPDGTHRTAAFPPTDARGTSSVSLDPIQAANGTIIPYQVCLVYTTSGAPCRQGTFVIWTN